MSDDTPLDPHGDELHRLLNTDETGVDPARRERAIRAALDAADGPRGSGSTTSADPVDPVPAVVSIPSAARRTPRLGRIAAVAATVLVVAALAGVVVSRAGTRSQDAASVDLKSSGSSAESSAAADSSTAAADGAASTTAPAAEAARAPTDFSALAAVLTDLGEFTDVSVLIAAAPTGTVDTGTAQVPGSVCAEALQSSGSVPVAVARLSGSAVLVARAGPSSGDGAVSVLSLPDCAVVAAG